MSPVHLWPYTTATHLDLAGMDVKVVPEWLERVSIYPQKLAGNSAIFGLTLSRVLEYIRLAETLARASSERVPQLQET